MISKRRFGQIFLMALLIGLGIYVYDSITRVENLPARGQTFVLYGQQYEFLTDATKVDDWYMGQFKPVSQQTSSQRGR